MNYENTQSAAGALNRTYPINGSAAQQTSMTPPVALAQSGLDEATDRLHGVIGELLSRLAPVLGPSQPGKESLNSPPPSSVASRIAQSAGVVQGACNRLSDILSRLEV